MGSRRMERLGGVFIATVSTIVTAWNWRMAIHQGYFYFNAALIWPALMIIGFGLVLYPSYRTERIERGEDISQLSGLALLTPRWWSILAISAVSALINLGALQGVEF